MLSANYHHAAIKEAASNLWTLPAIVNEISSQVIVNINSRIWYIKFTVVVTT